MAKQDKATYDSYAPDAFDNPPIGPVGVHRGPRSAGARMAPYLCVLLVALLVGVLTWGVTTGDFAKILNLPGSTQSAQSSDTKSSDSKQSGDAASGDAANGTDSNSSDSANSSDSNQQGSSTDANQADGAQADQSHQQTDQQQADQNAQPNKATAVRVVNATGVSGYAAQQAGVLNGAGYTSVEAANPTGTLPSASVVWYQNDADKATAQDVATTLGIADVQQTSGLDVPGVAILMN